MAQIFYVHCPRCGGKFPCHSELWQVEYALLCPFCQLSFQQEESPLILTASGERRPGSRAAAGMAQHLPQRADRPGSGEHSMPADDPSAHAESM